MGRNFNWRKDISTSLVDCLTGVILQSDDPDNLCSKWEKALGKTKSSNELTCTGFKTGPFSNLPIMAGPTGAGKSFI